MTTFGFSAFLKLIHLNDRPQRREVRQRIIPSESSYDFHRTFRAFARRLVVEQENIEALLAETERIVRLPERNSARNALQRLDAWRLSHPAVPIQFEKLTYESPTGVYKVNFTPDFGLELGGSRVAIHAWNTATPDLQSRLVSAALALFQDLPPDGPDELAVLSVRSGQLYRVRTPEAFEGLAHRIAEHIEDVFNELRDEDRRRPLDDSSHPRGP
jgi:hypothetical protein